MSPPRPRRAALGLAGLTLLLAGEAARGAPGQAGTAADDEVVVEMLEHAGTCTAAVVRKQDLARRCAPLLIQARYRDGHTSWLFFIEGAAEVSFHGTRDFRREPGTHVVLLDRLRVRKVSQEAPGYCTISGDFGDPARLVYSGPVTIRCRAGTPAEGDLADLTFRTAGAPARRDPAPKRASPVLPATAPATLRP